MAQWSTGSNVLPPVSVTSLYKEPTAFFTAHNLFTGPLSIFIRPEHSSLWPQWLGVGNLFREGPPLPHIPGSNSFLMVCKFKRFALKRNWLIRLHRLEPEYLRLFKDHLNLFTHLQTSQPYPGLMSLVFINKVSQ